MLKSEAGVLEFVSTVIRKRGRIGIEKANEIAAEVGPVGSESEMIDRVGEVMKRHEKAKADASDK